MARSKGARHTTGHKSRSPQVRLGSKARGELAAKLEDLHSHIERLRQQQERYSQVQRAWPVEVVLVSDATARVKAPQPAVSNEQCPRVITNVYRESPGHPGKMCRLELQGNSATWRVVMDPMLDRMDEDCAREINRLERETAAIDMLLNPPIGRPRERIYYKALLEKEEDPSLTIRNLAEKYLPLYFPEHAEEAIDAMRHGIASARKRKGVRKRS